MSDVADLWTRIEEARRRLGTDDEAQVKQVEEINDQVKEVRGSLARRYRELEQHREEVSKLRRENEQLRRMLHRLLLAIEQRRGSRLRKLMEGLEGEVNALAPLTADPKTAGAQEAAPLRSIASEVRELGTGAQAPRAKTGGARAGKESGTEPAAAAEAPKLGVPQPSETDSRWLHEIMERARELSGTEDAPAPLPSRLEAKRSAVA